MSWAKLAGKNLSSSADKDASQSEAPSPASSRRESSGSASAVKGLFKKLNSAKTSGDSSALGSTASEGAWKTVKRMSMSVGKDTDRSSAGRTSDGSLGLGIADLARTALQQQQGQEIADKGLKKMTSAFKKLGKAHMILT